MLLGKNITTMGTDAFDSCPILECVSYSAIAPVMHREVRDTVVKIILIM